ncbi:MAG TPA: TIGR02186 family protein [Stellaceae bacterium]|nr:TIGR02186 family protein [Stellaceae bacterium]
MKRAFLAAALGLALVVARPAAAQSLVADLTEHFVAITAGFNGATVTLFGTTESEGDIVVVVRGPKRDTVVREKSHLAGIWLNARSVIFAGVPGYYATLSSRPIDDLLPAPRRQLNGIGVDVLRMQPVGADPTTDVAAFRQAMLSDLERSGLYTNRSGNITFLGKHLFRTTLSFPASVPTGAYTVEVFLVRNGDVVTSETIPLGIEQTGFEAALNDISEAHALIYAIVAVLVAAMAGWLGSLVFRSAR